VVVIRGGRAAEGLTEDFVTVGVSPPASRGARFSAILRPMPGSDRLVAEPTGFTAP
jgi:hypothetical protein